MTDPAEIDLENLYEKAGWLNPVEKKLVAAVEALRERVAGLENLEADFKTLSKLTIAELFLRGLSFERAESAEAHAVELTMALGEVEHSLIFYEGNEETLPIPRTCVIVIHADDFNPMLKDIRTALATTPPQALERARAKDDFITEYRKYVAGGFRGDLGRRVDEAFDKLDVLDSAEQEDG